MLHARKSLQGMKFRVSRDALTQTVSQVSMGEGQEKVARDKNHAAFITGGWLILQNCHLGIDYMNEVEDTTLVGNINYSTYNTQRLGSQLKGFRNSSSVQQVLTR